jgi:hypothetical protein
MHSTHLASAPTPPPRPSLPSRRSWWARRAARSRASRPTSTASTTDRWGAAHPHPACAPRPPPRRLLLRLRRLRTPLCAPAVCARLPFPLCCATPLPPTPPPCAGRGRGARRRGAPGRARRRRQGAARHGDAVRGGARAGGERAADGHGRALGRGFRGSLLTPGTLLVPPAHPPLSRLLISPARRPAPLLTRPHSLVEAFGSTRRKRQLKAREEGVVRADRLLSAGAAEAALAAVNAKAAAEGATREEVRREGRGGVGQKGRGAP